MNSSMNDMKIVSVYRNFNTLQYFSLHTILLEYIVELLSDSYEGSSATELLQFLSPHIRTRGAQPS